MPNSKSLSPQEVEGILKRLFAVAELLAKGTSKRHSSSEPPQDSYEKDGGSNVVYCDDKGNLERREE